MVRNFNAQLWSMLCILACCGPTSSYGEPLQSLQEAHGISYVTGGIGSEEVEALEPFKSQYGVYLMFTEGKVGRVIDDVNVRILNQNKQVIFSVAHAGPRLLLNLAAGNYTIIAENQGEKIRYALHYPTPKKLRVILNWKRVVDEDQTEVSAINDSLSDAQPVMDNHNAE